MILLKKCVQKTVSNSKLKLGSKRHERYILFPTVPHEQKVASEEADYPGSNRCFQCLFFSYAQAKQEFKNAISTIRSKLFAVQTRSYYVQPCNYC